MSEVIITVRGEHDRRVAPERAVAHLTVSTEGPERGPVVEQIAALTEPVRTDLAARKDAGGLLEWSSQRVSIWSDRPWNAEGKRLAPVHHASVELTATFADAASLSWWVAEVADRDGVQIGTVDWRLTPETRSAVEREVAKEAVQVAVARATAYADALDLVAVTPLEVADLGLLTRAEPASPGSPKMLRASFASADAGGGPSLEFQPDDIVVTAGVEARFSAR